MPVSGEAEQGEDSAWLNGPVVPGALPRPGKSGVTPHRTVPHGPRHGGDRARAGPGRVQPCGSQVYPAPSSYSGEKTTRISVQHFI